LSDLSLELQRAFYLIYGSRAARPALPSMVVRDHFWNHRLVVLKKATTQATAVILAATATDHAI
jgi:hypothetical protein